MLEKTIRILLLGLSVVIISSRVSADEIDEPKGLVVTPWEEGWSVGAHWGQAIDNTVTSLEAFQPYTWDPLDYHIVSVGVRKKLISFDKYASIYTELNASYIYGDEEYAEVFFTPTLSWEYFPWDGYLDTTASVGVGLSYATEESDLDDAGSKMLASVIFELEFALPEDKTWSVYTRIHHRSPAYGTFGHDGGSNFPSIGLRYHFN